MDLFFKPRGIAVVGATANPHKGGNSILKNLLRYYKGKIYPVNPKYDAIEGLPCYASIRDIPGRAHGADYLSFWHGRCLRQSRKVRRMESEGHDPVQRIRRIG